MCKQGTAAKRKHVTSTITQKLEIIMRYETDKIQRQFMAPYDIGS
jgi:hypothetical protein